MKYSKLSRVFLRRKPVELVMELGSPTSEKYASKIAKRIDCTYSHATKIFSDLKDEGIVENNRTGRVNMLKLTDKGKELFNKFCEVVRLLED